MAGLQLAGERPRHLLVVDDCSVIREMWKLAVEAWDLPLRLTTAVDGYQAIFKMAKDRPDLVITDIDMPNIDGRQLITIMSHDPDYARIPVIVISGGEMAGLSDFPSVLACMTKPFRFENVRHYLEKIPG